MQKMSQSPSANFMRVVESYQGFNRNKSVPMPCRNAPVPKTTSVEELMEEVFVLQDAGLLNQASTLLKKIEAKLSLEENRFIDDNSISIVGDGESECTFDILGKDSVSTSNTTSQVIEETSALNKDSSMDQKSFVTGINDFSIPASKNINSKNMPVLQADVENVIEPTRTKKVTQSYIGELMLPDTNTSKHESFPTITKSNTTNTVSSHKLSKNSNKLPQTPPSSMSTDRKKIYRMLTKVGYMAVPKFFMWQRRYVVLTGRFLIIFKGKTKQAVENIVDLSHGVVEAVEVKYQNGKKQKVSYELRIKTGNGKLAQRLKATDKNAISLAKDVSDWTTCIRNNILVAKRNNDMRANDIKYMKELLGNLNASDADELSDKIMILNRLQSEELENKYILQEKAPDDVEEQRQEKYFSPTKNGAPTTVGVDVGIRSENEEIDLLYKRLQVSKDASSSKLKRTYYKLARSYHPDKRQDTTFSESRNKKFSEISAAYSVLKDSKSRSDYDNCEKIKKWLRQGISVRFHRTSAGTSRKLLFIDSKFLNLYLQDEKYGTILHKNFNSIEMRFVTHIYNGRDGFVLANNDITSSCSQDIPELDDNSFNCCLSLHGPRIGETDWHLQFCDIETKNNVLKGLRKMRCDISELFKQRLEEMRESGLS